MVKHIDYIYAIYQERSFTKAAEKLYVSQPALSQSIKKLEEELGYPLFERRGKETLPTVYGEKYIMAIEEIKRIQTNLENEIADMTNLRSGKVKIGSTTFISVYILPDILKKFKNTYPKIDIELSVDQSTVLREKLDREDVDIIIDNAASISENLHYEPLFEENVLIGIPQEFEINQRLKKYAISYSEYNCNAKTPKLNISELANEKFILLKEGNSMREISSQMFHEAKIQPSVAIEFDHLFSAIGYAEHGFGICMITDTILKNRETNLTLYFPDSKISKRTVYITTKKNKYIGAAAREFIRFAHQALDI